jgi:hypothetical protein
MTNKEMSKHIKRIDKDIDKLVKLFDTLVSQVEYNRRILKLLVQKKEK